MPTGLAAWLALLERRHPTKIELGLSRVELVRQHLSLTLPMPIVLIAGTNGKGSICVFMEAILRAAGFRVGCYTSPHLLRFNERLRINGVMAADKDFVESFQRVEKARAATAVSLTYFEFTTLAAAEIIAAQNCDFALLEVGMGGRLDAVNVFPPAVSVVSGVGLDHCDYLGDTVEKIAVEKAGIFRNQRPAVIGQHDPPESLLVAARKVGALLRVTGDDFTVQESNGRCWNYQGHHRLSNLPLPNLLGRHQKSNAACAIAALESLPADCWPGVGAVRRGLQTAFLPGRGQVLAGRPTVVLDVAHNGQAAAVLERLLFDMGYYPKTTAVLGIMKHKNMGDIVQALAPRIDYWYTAQPAGGDAKAEDIAAAVAAAGQPATACMGGVGEAVRLAMEKSGESDRIVILGSF